jgi:Ca-activated chloride channel family protein
MFRFEHIELLWLLAVLPAFYFLYVLFRWKRKKALENFGDEATIAKLMPNTSKYKPTVKMILFLFASALFIVGIANPQFGTKLQEVKRKGVEVMIALDVSNSMLAEDLKPNRLERAKQAVNRLIDKMENDKIGLVVFAGDAYLQLPLTTDFAAAKLLLSSISTSMIETQGTALGAAIELAMDSFSEENKKQKALIIISDGENHEDDAVGIAKKAQEKNIIIHTIGMGSVDGAPIPIYRNGEIASYYKDNDGSTVVSKLNSGMLSQLAEVAGGRFTRASLANTELSDLLDEIAGMEKQEFGSKEYTDYISRYMLFILPALLIFILEFMLSESKNRILTSMNLFGGGK